MNHLRSTSLVKNKYRGEKNWKKKNITYSFRQISQLHFNNNQNNFYLSKQVLNQ